jgi:S-adenosylmethionine:tRNA ribosyltransferase-isomerase
MSVPFTFTLPEQLAAKEPPERRGISRDGVRLMVINRANYQVTHTRFNHVSNFFNRGDLLVFNSSRTLPACLKGCQANGNCLEVRLAEKLPDDSWLALLLCQQGEIFSCGLCSGMQLEFGLGLTATVEQRDSHITRLWQIRFSHRDTELIDLFYRLGQPVRYEYVSQPWDLDYYQTVYAVEPGSAEMPSAGRAFTWKLLFDLKRRGIDTANIVLHTGLSSYMDDELDAQHPASEEEYLINDIAADKINRTKSRGGRIVAVGTTVVRALESAANQIGTVTAQHGYTRLHINANHQLKIVDGLLTGMHEPEASHLDLLTAFLPAKQIKDAYTEAVQKQYLWHEFGDLNLIV